MSQSEQDSRALYQARYVLTSLGVETRFTARGDALKGELDLSLHRPLRNPITGELISHLSFNVASNARLIVQDPPPLRGTCTVIDELVSIDHLIEQLGSALLDRVSRVSALCERLQRMGLDATLDGERATGVVGITLAPEGTAVLEVDAHGLVARYLIPGFGDKARLPLGELRIDVDSLSDRSDLEITLAEPIARALAERPQRGRAQDPEIVLDTPAPVQKGRVAHPDQPPSLRELARHFGKSAFPKPGFTIGRPLVVEGEEVRLIAQHLRGSVFDVRLRGKAGELFQGEVDLEGVGKVEEWVQAVLGGASRVEAVDDDLAAEAGEDEAHTIAGLLPPVPNESWVMDVRVDDDDGIEVRYRGLNVGGMTFGAPRILPKPAFEASYLPSDNGYRMLVRVLEVDEANIVYQRLDATRAPVGTPKQTSLVVFLATFIAESAAY